jgi:hypothetical protein
MRCNLLIIILPVWVLDVLFIESQQLKPGRFAEINATSVQF